MTSRAICVAVLLSTLPAAGCGTVANLARSNPDQGGKIPFGGVRQDMACLQRPNAEACGKGGTESEQHSQMMLKFFCAADLPFSLIGDLVTWPYAISYGVINQPIPVPPVTFADPPVIRPTNIPPATDPAPLPIPTIPPAPGQMPIPAPPPTLLPESKPKDPAPVPALPESKPKDPAPDPLPKLPQLPQGD